MVPKLEAPTHNNPDILDEEDILAEEDMCTFNEELYSRTLENRANGLCDQELKGFTDRKEEDERKFLDEVE